MGRQGMNALTHAAERFQRVREGMEEAAVALMVGDLYTVEHRCRTALYDLRDAWPTFAKDEAALAEVIALLATAGAWCGRHRKQVPEALRQLHDTATDIRLRWLEGEE